MVIDPAGLGKEVDSAVEAPMPEMEGLVRMVCRNDAAVRAVLVNGHVAAERGAVAPTLGRVRASDDCYAPPGDELHRR